MSTPTKCADCGQSTNNSKQQALPYFDEYDEVIDHIPVEEIIKIKSNGCGGSNDDF